MKILAQEEIPGASFLSQEAQLPGGWFCQLRRDRDELRHFLARPSDVAPR
jgi:hypothetical protein